MKKLNSKGLAHHLLLPVIAVLLIGGIGAYVLTKSHAATAVDSARCTYDGDYARLHLRACAVAMNADIIITSTGKGGVYVKRGTSSTGQINLANPNWAYVRAGSWKICDDVRIGTDNCSGRIPSSVDVDLCKFRVGWTNSGTVPKYACTYEDAYAKHI